MDMEENKAGEEDEMEGKKGNHPCVTMAPTNIQLVAIDSLLWISFVFYLILSRDRTGGKVLALCSAKQKVSMDFHKDF